jgi:hypothetical protein
MDRQARRAAGVDGAAIGGKAHIESSISGAFILLIETLISPKR